MDNDDRYYCADCWDRRTSPAPARCRRPERHAHSTAVKIGIVIEHADGTKTHIASDNFDWVDLEITPDEYDRPLFAYDPELYLPPARRNLNISIHNVRKYMMTMPKPDEPRSIDDGTVVEEG